VTVEEVDDEAVEVFELDEVVEEAFD